MQREVADPVEQVLAARHHLANGLAGQVDGREPGHPQVASGEHPPGERRVLLPRGEVNRVALGHLLPLPSPPADASNIS